MAINPRTIKSMNQLDYSRHADILVNWIKKHWDIGEPAPKGYAEYMEDYEEFNGMEELDEKQIMKEFKGLDDSGAGNFSFPMSMSLPHIAYDDRGQGRNPLRMLVSCIFTYGIRYGQKLEAVYENSSMNYKVNHMKHCVGMAHGDDLAEKITYELQHTDVARIGSNWMEVGKKWDKIREKVKEMRVVWFKHTNYQRNKKWDVINRKQKAKHDKETEGWKEMFPHRDTKTTDYKNKEKEFAEYIFMKFHGLAYD